MKESNTTPNKTIKEWLKFADENFSVAGHELEREDAACHTICFLCQEAAEKYLKAYLISKGWKFFHKKTLSNQHYDTYDKFKNKCLSFFKNIGKYKAELRALLTDNFQIIGEQISKT